MFKKLAWIGVMAATVLTLQGCAGGVDHSQPVSLMQNNTSVAVLPLKNVTGVRGAGVIAGVITTKTLRGKGIYANYIPLYWGCRHSHKTCYNYRYNLGGQLAWARAHHYSLLMRGIVDVWGYRMYMGQVVPVVTVGLELRDTATGAIVWSAMGSRDASNAGIAYYYGNTTVGAARDVISNMLNTVNTYGVVGVNNYGVYGLSVGRTAGYGVHGYYGTSYNYNRTSPGMMMPRF